MLIKISNTSWIKAKQLTLTGIADGITFGNGVFITTDKRVKNKKTQAFNPASFVRLVLAKNVQVTDIGSEPVLDREWISIVIRYIFEEM